jgi:phosphatidylserine decarboxylase
MNIDRAGLPFVIGALFPAAVCAVLWSPVWALPFIVLSGFFAFFFRDPERAVPTTPDIVIAPADGRVVHAGPAEADVAPPGQWIQISIFLSPLDVHVNRTPVSGRVLEVHYVPGRFLPAYRREAASDNERSEISIEHSGRIVVVRQVVGLLARRVVCRLTPGMEVAQGQRLGIMKFGSRMDVFLPTDAVLKASVDQTVRGGQTIIAELAPAASAEQANSN